MKLRLDQYLCQNGLAQSRERAKALIMSGVVFVDEQKVDKAGEMIPEDACPEGELAWIEKEKISSLPTWEGDRIFLSLLSKNAPFFSLKLVYDRESRLTSAVLDGKELKAPFEV